MISFPLRHLALAVTAVSAATLVGCTSCGSNVTIGKKDGGAGGSASTGGGDVSTGGGTSGGTGGGDAGGSVGGGDAGGDSGGGAGGGSTQLCTLVTCASVGATCGPIGDGCGGYVNCGTCQAPQTCGGDGRPSQCGGSQGCTPKTCASENANCGPIADGCGGVVNCGACTVMGETCGGGGVPSRCGASGTALVDGGCPALTQCPQGLNCGAYADGCGGTINCGTCTVSGETCGGGGMSNVCGASNSCVPRSCAQAGANCGQVGDGCGGLTPNCGSCDVDAGILCGVVSPNVCGNAIPDGGVCTNLCQQQNQCDAGTNTVTGTVFAPTNAALGYGNPDPIPGALVYVPNGTVRPLAQGASCESCAGQASGNPLVTAISATNGTFTLTNVPCGNNIPLVIQLGKWRRQVSVNVACCGNTALSANDTRLPRDSSEGDLPLIAHVTGSADPMECILPKIGIAASEFTAPNGTGRVRLYRDNGVSFPNGGTAAGLFGSLTELMKYDLVIVDCVGSPTGRTQTELDNLRQYLNSGGRIYLSHYGYVWTHTNNPFNTVANWQGNQPSPPSSQSAYIDQSFPKGITFANWLLATGGSTTLGRVTVQQTRRDTNGLPTGTPAQQWIYSESPAAPNSIPFQFTWNTPVGVPAANQCGRVLFSDFHVSTGGAGFGTFPASCGAAAPMSGQEKVLEFMIFDLTSCIQPDNGQLTCRPRTCMELGFACGLQGDGCGGTVDCGMCPSGQFCGGSGQPGQCGGSMCTPRTCAQQNLHCGMAGDGCGGTIDCGMCPSGQVCGAGGPGQCGFGSCQPRTCAQQNLQCGPAGDGCGNLIQCGQCSEPDTCGGGGMPGVCGRTNCQGVTCAQADAGCGVIGDGCGNLVNCGPCVAPQTCGGSGIPHQCGGIQ